LEGLMGSIWGWVWHWVWLQMWVWAYCWYKRSFYKLGAGVGMIQKWWWCVKGLWAF
jgi:hypothetical protein